MSESRDVIIHYMNMINGYIQTETYFSSVKLKRWQNHF